MIFNIFLFSTLLFAQVDLSHKKHCFKISKLIDQIAKTKPDQRGLINAACQKGSGRAFFELKEKNSELPQIAKTNLAKRGCDLGYTPACVFLSKNIHKTVNPEKTVKDLKGKCIQGHVPACASLGIIQNRKKKYSEALKSFNFACESGDGESCFMMGQIYEKQGKMKSSLKMHEYSCNKKNMPRSCLVVGKSYLNNKAKEPKATRYYLKRACDGAIEEACFLLEKL